MLIHFLAWSALISVDANSPLVLDVHQQTSRSLGAAGAYAGFGDDASGLFSHPAGIGRFVSARHASFSSRFLSKAKNYSLMPALIDGRTEDPLTWGFAASIVRTGDEKRENYILGTSYNFNNRVLIGFNSELGHHRQAALTQSLWIYSGDVSASLFLGDHLLVSGGARNFIRSKSRSSIAPRTVFGAGSVNLKSLRLGGELERDFSNKVWTGKSAVELQPSEWLTVRGGFFWAHRKAEDERGYSAGLSLQPMPQLGIHAGYLDRLKSNFKAFSAGFSADF
jgi:hypothetical protein